MTFATASTERMRLDSSGNLGVGTASPEQRLHLSNTGSTSVAIKFTNSAASAGIISYSSDSLLFYTANAIRATIDTSGNLGIGKTSPQASLDYRQTVNVISTNTTAVASRTYVFTATLTLTLPASPTAGDWVMFSNRSATATPVIGRNGQNIMGLAEDLMVNNVNYFGTLVYADATRGWIFQ